MKVLTIIGTRPELLKLSRLWASIIVNTGQHYDANLNDIHDAVNCDYNLLKTSLGETIDAAIEIVNDINPKIICVLGDTRSTLAGAICAKMCNKTLVHIEAGMRCYDNEAIEERIRMSVDKMADHLLCTDKYCQRNLSKEGLHNSTIVGDPVYDKIMSYDLDPYSTSNENLITLHRAELVDNRARLSSVLHAIGTCEEYSFVWPIHPRTKARIQEFGLLIPKNIRLIDPISHKRLVSLLVNSEFVATDSGGIQREAYWLGKTVIIPRSNTEHQAIIDTGYGIIVGYSSEYLANAIRSFRAGNLEIIVPPANAHENIAAYLEAL